MEYRGMTLARLQLIQCHGIQLQASFDVNVKSQTITPVGIVTWLS